MIKEKTEISRSAWSTGELGSLKKEQSLVIKTQKGIILITGCGHPGIVNMADFVIRNFGKIYMILGGFHTEHKLPFMVKNLSNKLKSLGIKK